MFCTGLFFSLLTYFGAQWLIDWQFVRHPRAYYSIIALAPAVFFVTILASSRGIFSRLATYDTDSCFTDCGTDFPCYYNDIIAQLLLPYGLEFASAGASLGALAGAVTGVMVLVYFHIKLEKDIVKTYGNELKPSDPKSADFVWKIIKRIFVLALPVSAASIMLPIVSNLDLLIVPARLEVAGYTVNEATELFGYLTGMAVPLVNLSTILTASLAVI